MSSDVPDVELLFSPPPEQSDVEMVPETGSPEPPRSPSAQASSEHLSRLTSLSLADNPPSVYVEVATLPAEKKAKYATLAERPITSDEEFPEEAMERVLGEYKSSDGEFYFVRMSSGVAFKFQAEKFKKKHPALVERYKRDRDAGSLEPFDPSASYIEPSSRVRLTLKVGPPKKKEKKVEPISESEDELAVGFESSPQDSADDAFTDADESDHVPRRRSARAVAATKGDNKKQTTLPFSPKKTRSRKIVIDLEDEDDEDDSTPSRRPTPQGTRRSTRTSKRVRANLDDDDFIDDGEYEGPSRGKSRTTKKKAAPKKIPRGYGLVHDHPDAFVEEPGVTAHRKKCEKCHKEPTHKLLGKPKGKRGRKKKVEDDFEDDEDDQDRTAALGGWVRCLKCPVAAHWGCLAKTQRDEILKAIFEKDKAKWEVEKAASGDMEDSSSPPPEPVKRSGIEAHETTEFICGSCMKGGVCMACKESAIAPGGIIVRPTHSKPDASKPEAGPSSVADGDVVMNDGTKDGEPVPTGDSPEPKPELDTSDELLYRCITCKRVAHYAHLPLSRYADPDETYTVDDIAEYYQSNTSWQCADCVSFTYTVEHIIAWRPFPDNAVEPPLLPGELPNYKSPLPREYLVKWVDRSYKRLNWVPHMWLLATYPAKLKNFLSKGSHVPLLPEPVADDAVDKMDLGDAGPAFANDDEEMGDDLDGSAKKDEGDVLAVLHPTPDAERRIPPAWKTVDRVLDILLWKRKAPVPKKAAPKGKRGARRQVVSDDEDEEEEEATPGPLDLSEEALADRQLAYEEGEQPRDQVTETVEEFEKRTKRMLNEKDVELVAWGFFKWNGLGYEESTWESPPPQGAPGWIAFQEAFKRFLSARTVKVPVMSKSERVAFDERPKNRFMRNHKFTPDNQPELGQGTQLRLMPFQVDGVNWLCNNWWNLQHCILADEMGLGKTVQIAAFLGQVIKGFEGLPFQAFPALVVVPNSTITNWVREFERWAPKIRVVPFYGDAKAREIIRQYELSHASTAAKTTGAKFHVLVTTYETFTNAKDVGTLFKSVPRWEVLVVDEGQRLKSDSSLLFRKLKELNIIHRIILTGTPLNNNIRELFNLMNFLDPSEWNDLDALTREYEDLTEEKIKELHAKLRPYFLRRIKSEVLQLPPKNEVIVPVSMTPLQKEVYRSILSQNVDVLRTIALTSAGSKVNAAVKKSNMNNILMQLRKCLQHPYLVSRDIEPAGLPPKEAHERLIGASAKLLMLQSMLPKLKARGHRVLLFSQFAIALDIIEDYLNGEGIKYLRLDGSTKQADRQKDMDEFNKPDSDIFIYILSTRAGGVGINLTTADTVIIFDPDFNPHQDLQAIARAHRYGQKKTVLVFKFMVKDSAEDRIMQTGKKKLVLDHLIVQKMDNNDSDEDVKSILMFGAKALFEEGDAQSARDIHYSDNDIQQLIEKTEKEGDKQEPSAGEGFAFAKVWAAEKDENPDVEQAAQEDAWAQTLARIAEERAKERALEETGRGVRRRAAAVFPQQNLEILDTPAKGKDKKGKGKQKATKSDDDEAFNLSEIEDSDATVSAAASDDLDISLADQLAKQKKKGKYIAPPLSPIHNRLALAEPVETTCALCGAEHPNRPCFMTESSENLAEYRRILTTMDSDEPIEERRAAVAIIDETLHKRGKMKLIINQPLHPVERNPAPRRPPPVPAPVRHSIPAAAPSTSAPIRNVPAIPQLLPQSKPVPRPIINGGSAIRPSNNASGHKVTANGKAPVVQPPQPRHSVPGPSTAPAIAGSSRRPPSPVRGEPPKKKVKESSATSACPVCNSPSFHPLVSCPLVREGPQRIETEIRRLRKDPAKAETVSGLQKILRRQLLAGSGSKGQ